MHIHYKNGVAVEFLLILLNFKILLIYKTIPCLEITLLGYFMHPDFSGQWEPGFFKEVVEGID